GHVAHRPRTLLGLQLEAADEREPGAEAVSQSPAPDDEAAQRCGEEDHDEGSRFFVVRALRDRRSHAGHGVPGLQGSEWPTRRLEYWNGSRGGIRSALPGGDQLLQSAGVLRSPRSLGRPLARVLARMPPLLSGIDPGGRRPASLAERQLARSEAAVP